MKQGNSAVITEYKGMPTDSANCMPQRLVYVASPRRHWTHRRRTLPSTASERQTIVLKPSRNCHQQIWCPDLRFTDSLRHLRRALVDLGPLNHYVQFRFRARFGSCPVPTRAEGKPKRMCQVVINCHVLRTMLLLLGYLRYEIEWLLSDKSVAQLQLS